eukprot:TRINITY_DN14268_c0_g1_i1.p1 TRINITY_DN14268_c0_g1~~TRINITY_DN14268_c0_g1_i1.p1  ORF type:complete len:794 (-),score=167.22 TRINITY_DN14268_c0_g1_i1:557-2938(-)
MDTRLESSEMHSVVSDPKQDVFEDATESSEKDPIETTEKEINTEDVKVVKAIEKEIKAEKPKHAELMEKENEMEIERERTKVVEIMENEKEKKIMAEEMKAVEVVEKDKEITEVSDKEIKVTDITEKEKDITAEAEPSKKEITAKEVITDVTEKEAKIREIEEESRPDKGIESQNGNRVYDENKNENENVEKEVPEPVFDGTEREISPRSESLVSKMWPEKAAAIKNYVIERGVLIRRFSEPKVFSDVIKRFTKTGEGDQAGTENRNGDEQKEGPKDNELKTPTDWSAWNPINLVRSLSDKREGAPMGSVIQNKPEAEASSLHKSRITLYTSLENPHCRAARAFLKEKGLKYVEINIDIYPGRKVDLMKRTSSATVPKLFIDDVYLGGIAEIRGLEEQGKFDETVKTLLEKERPDAAPSAPSAQEDDFSSTGMVDDYVNVVKKLRESLVIKDRFYKMRLFSRCFVGSEAVDFIAEDQLLERDEAVDFGRKLAQKHFFHHVLEENVFEDGNHLYRFMEHDPIISTRCFNFMGATNDLKPRSLTEISSRLRRLIMAIYEAYISEDGKHIDYKGIGASEEFVRYLKVIEDLQRADMHDFPREEKLAFFINLYNMMTIHAIILWGYPEGALERRKFFGDFRYVIGGYAYSLSAIHNGVLRGNQRPPYNLMKPFGPKDKRLKVALEQPEPLIHFALSSGSKSSPPVRCYSPGSIDEELRLAAKIFFDDSGFTIDGETKTISLSKLLKWYSVDFGKNESEVVKFVAKYLETTKSEQLLGLLNNNQLKITYQNYDWSLNL